MFRLEGGRPGDARGFLHKSFIGKAVGKAVTTFVPGASTAVGLVSTARSLLGGRGRQGGRGFGRRPARATVPRTLTARPTLSGQQGQEFARTLKFGGAEGTPLTTLGPATFRPSALSLPFVPSGGNGVGPQECPSGTVPDPEGGGFCVSPRSPFGKGRGATRAPVGDAVMGRYGAALEPGIMVIERSVCLPGMQLGNDGLCYNKGAITNKQRQWPRGRKPLLTGGDMRAIAIAARAGSTLDRTTKRLRALGLMKRLPAPRKTAAHAHAKPVAAVSV